MKFHLQYARRYVKDVYYMDRRNTVRLCKDCTHFQKGKCMYLQKPKDAVEMRLYSDLCGPIGRFYSEDNS